MIEDVLAIGLLGGAIWYAYTSNQRAQQPAQGRARALLIKTTYPQPVELSQDMTPITQPLQEFAPSFTQTFGNVLSSYLPQPAMPSEGNSFLPSAAYYNPPQGNTPPTTYLPQSIAPVDNRPRGIRNNNPGNIRRSSDQWQGMAAQQLDPAFVQFTDPKWGIRAMAILLKRYQAQYGLVTLQQIIGRWAPASDNNDTSGYVVDVARRLGIMPQTTLDLQRSDILSALIQAMIWHENGQQPYSIAVVNAGVSTSYTV
jgi:hypothetical protein